MAKFIDIVGNKYGRWTVISNHRGKSTECICTCDCGVIKNVNKYSLTTNKSLSCGCLQREITSIALTTHGLARTWMYTIWGSMIQRCTNPKNSRYKRYGGRGILVCDRWRIFENFLADMGERPTPRHTIDRINNDGCYAPDNCRWATPSEQCRNYCKNVSIEYLGKPYGSIIELAEYVGMNYKALHQRIKRGWSVERAVETPIYVEKRNHVFKRDNGARRQVV